MHAYIGFFFAAFFAVTAGATACTSGSYLSGSACALCPAGTSALGGALYASQCLAVPFVGPTDTVWSYSFDAAEGVDSVVLSNNFGSPQYAPDRFGNAQAAQVLGPSINSLTVS